MEKRSPNRWERELAQVEPEPPAGVLLRSNFPDILNSIGPATGKRYHFPSGGSVVEVDALDAPLMLKKVFGGYSCCGSGVGPTPMFTVV